MHPQVHSPGPPGPLLRYLSSEMGGPGAWGGGLLARLRGFCAMSLGGLCEVITLPTFWHASWRKGGPGGENTREVVRLSSARSQHLTVVLRVRPCSITTRLPCVAEGGSFFFTAAGTGSDRSPSETMQRYAFPRVRRASASGASGGKGCILGLRTMLSASRAGET